VERNLQLMSRIWRRLLVAVLISIAFNGLREALLNRYMNLCPELFFMGGFPREPLPSECQSSWTSIAQIAGVLGIPGSIFALIVGTKLFGIPPSLQGAAFVSVEFAGSVLLFSWPAFLMLGFLQNRWDERRSSNITNQPIE
jgi:hypothetical protein